MAEDIGVRECLAAVLRRERQAAGKSLRDVGKAAGLSIGFLSDVENGKCGLGVETFVSWCHALGLCPAWVLDRALQEVECD
jgi:transcriptional regulator with XRE-family HTH domain